MVDDIVPRDRNEISADRCPTTYKLPGEYVTILPEDTRAGGVDAGSEIRIDKARHPVPAFDVAVGRDAQPSHHKARRRLYRDSDPHEVTEDSKSSHIEESIFRLLVENSTDVLVLADVQLQRSYVSPSCLEVMGYHQSELVGRTPANLIHPDDKDRVMGVFSSLNAQNPTASASWRMLRPDGLYRWMETTYRRLPDARIVSAVRDIQSRKEIEEQLAEALGRVERLAMHDPLTSLPNRRSFLEAVGDRLADTLTPDSCAVFLIDLNRFKPINDIHGHAAGDQVLIEVAARLQRLSGPSTSFARLGGDEFAALVSAADPQGTALLAQKIVIGLSAPFLIGRLVVELGASVGIALSPRDGTDTIALLRHADAAMYHAKRCKRAGYHFFDPSMDGAAIDNVELQMQLRDAITSGQIVPYYHPLIDLQNGSLVGLEALARWEHPVRGTLSPILFIDLVEKLDLFNPLFDQILRRACKDAAGWPDLIQISINLSPSQLTNPDLPQRIMEILRSENFKPARLVLEITENLPLTDTGTARQVLAEISASGISIALDDFGMGHSSLSLLRDLKFDKLKIDRSFVTDHIPGGPNERYLKAIIGLGKSLDLQITAEGIETIGTMEALRDLGCAMGQGYLYGKPIPAHRVADLIAKP